MLQARLLLATVSAAAALVMVTSGANTAAVGSASTPSVDPSIPTARQKPSPVVFQPADKQGYATAYDTRSKVWLTLRAGAVSDVYYPTVSVPAVRGLQLVVTDGKTFTDTEVSDTRHRVRLLDKRSLTYQQVDVAKSGDYRITKTFVVDPRRSSIVVRIGFQSLTGKPYQVYVDYLPAIDNNPSHVTARRHGSVLTAVGTRSASALVARPAFTASTNEYQRGDGGLAQLRQRHRLVRHNATARDGVVEQTALTSLNGTAGNDTLRLVLGFGTDPANARRTARATLATDFADVKTRYQNGWHGYLDSLKPPPNDVLASARERTLYDVSLMILAAGEDKTHRGAFVASPTMPWAWRNPATNAPSKTGPYHLVWARDLYQIASALLVAGDRGAAKRAEEYLFRTQQLSNGQFPQNSTAAGTPYWTGRQLDEWSLPTVLAWQLGDTSEATWRHVRRAEDAVIKTGPWSEQERWENQSGYSPSTIAAEIAGLVCAADLARSSGHPATAKRYLAVADRWQAQVKRWTVTTNGPLSDAPYFLRLSKGGKPNRGTAYAIGDSGPKAIDQRRVVDPSFLELVRLGVLPPGDRAVRNTLDVVDRTLKVATPNGPFWHRFSHDGYGETARGRQWVIEGPQTPKTYGRLWPLLTGERGEYAISAGVPAAGYLAAMASTAKRGSYLMPEQVWDGRPPTGRNGHRLGQPTLSATPLLWTHAQYVRLAWDLHAGRLLEQPAVVSRRYVR